MPIRPLFVVVPAALVMAGLACVTVAIAQGEETGPPAFAHVAPPLGDSMFDGLDFPLVGEQLAQAAPPATPGAPNTSARPPRPPFSPQKMCLEMTAHRAGHLAYLKERLDLKPEQMAAWNAFEKASTDVIAKSKARCASMPTEIKKDAPPSFTDRLTRRETMMKARLDNLEAVKPSLLALYAALTPEQKEIFDRPPMGRMGMHGDWRGRHRPHPHWQH
jgi:hypothetical protein